MTITVDEILDQLDFEKIVRDEVVQSDPFLQKLEERADSKLVPFTPVTPEERLASFEKIGYRPHGLYVPDDAVLRADLNTRLQTVGDIPEVGKRFTAYYQLQRECWEWQTNGVPGHWTGQMAITLSRAQFRLVAYGRRSGKTLHASREAIALALGRPRSWIWLAAPDMDLVDRCFEMVVQVLRDLQIKPDRLNNSRQEKLIVLDNGSKIEGVSLEARNAGAAVDLAIIDEAAQVDPDAWNRVILPPLMDRNGQALLISSWEGDTGFFFEKAEAAKHEMMSKGGESDWEVFQAPSYEVNFFMFPKGRRSESLIRAEKEMRMSPHDFLEQFGAIPAGSRDKVFPEFKEKVHVGYFPFNPEHPVYVAADPAGGANPYGIVAIQDYGDYFNVVDEFYESHISVEDISPILKRRPWFGNVTQMVVDSALPFEIDRWCRMGWPAFPVSNKPKVDERIPLYRLWLRDPSRFRSFYRKKINEVLVERGMPPDYDLLGSLEGGMSEGEQVILAIEVEERISDLHMTEEDRAMLRGCARVRIDRSCYNTINEHKRYQYQKRKRGGSDLNYREVPMDKDNHIMDALGYFVWEEKRYEGIVGSRDYSTLESAVSDTPQPIPWDERKEDQEWPDSTALEGRFTSFIRTMREAYTPGVVRSYSILGSS